MVDAGQGTYQGIYNKLRDAVKKWTYLKSEIDTLLSGKSSSTHTHGNLQNDGKVGASNNTSKNVVTDSNGKITTEDKPSIPSASSTTPSADTTNGSVGTGTTWARSNHTHPKSSIYAESTHSHTKSEISDFPSLHTVATSGSYNDLTNKPNIPSGVVVDTSLDSTSDHAISNSAVTTALNGKSDTGHTHDQYLTSHQDITGKLDKIQTSYKGKNVVVDSTSGEITFEDKNNHTHSNYLTSSDISGKIDTAGTGLSKNGTTLNHSNSVTAQNSEVFKKFKYDATGHITGVSDVTSSDLPTHTHSQYITSAPTDVSELTDNNNTPFTPKTHNHGNLQDDGKIKINGTTQTSKNVVTDSSGNITTESKPNIPSKTSDLTNDSGFLTSHQDISGKANTNDLSAVAFSNDYDDLDNKPTIPSDVSDLSDNNNATFTPKSHSHGNLQNNGQVGSTVQASKNVVTDANGLITTENKPTIPSASSSTPLSDSASGTYGSGTSYARSNHRHPKSTLYAEASHTHNEYVNPTIYDGLDSNSTSQPLSARQGKLLKLTIDKLGVDKAYFDNHYYDVFTNQNEGYSYTLTNNGFTTVSGEDNDNINVEARHLISDYLSNGYVFSYDVQPSTPSNNPLYLTYNEHGYLDGDVYHVKHYSDENNYLCVDINGVQVDSDTEFISFRYDYGGPDNNWTFSNIRLVRDGYVKSSDLDEIEKARVENFYIDSTTKEVIIDYTTYTDLTGSEIVTSWSSTTSDSKVPSEKLVKDTFDDILNLVYPVGSIYMSVNSTSPETLFGGTWTQLEDTFLLACGSTYASDGSNVHTAQHGEATHKLTASESGQKDLGTVTSTGGDHTHKLSSTDTKARYLGTTSDGDGITRSSVKPGTSTAVSNFLKSANVIYRYDGNGSSGNLSVSTTISGSDATSSHNNMPPYLAVYMWKRTA